MYSLGLVNGKVYRHGTLMSENIYIKDGIIDKIVSSDIFLPCEETVDCKDKLVLPGFIDPHVHINLNLGEFQSSDDYESASKAAAFGGITTFIDFLEPIKYNNEFGEKFQSKMKEAQSSYIDYSFHTTLGNFKDSTREIVNTSINSGIPTIKIFTTYSESDRRITYPKLEELFKESYRTDLLILAHTENDAIVLNSQTEDNIKSYANSRPKEAELVEIEKLAGFVKKFFGKIYFVHVTCGSSVEFLRTEYPEFLNNYIFIESCPQYFYFTDDIYQTDNGRLFLLAPPLRSSEEQEKLKQEIDSVGVIGTDHCPFMKAEKLQYSQISKLPKGIGGLEYSFPLMFSLFGEKIIDKFTLSPSKIHGFYPKKGIIQEESDADIVIFDPEKKLVIDPGHSKSDYSPYENMITTGLIESTILRGEFVVKERKLVGGKRGQFVRRINLLEF